MAKILEISSPQNPLYKELLSLTEAKTLKKANRFIIYGKDLVAEFFKEFEQTPQLIPVISEIYQDGQVPLFPEKLRVKLSPQLFKELDVLGTHSPLLVVEKPLIPEVDWSKMKDGIHILLPFGDPGNLGAALRSAAAFGARSITFLAESANPFLPKSVKAAAGAHRYFWKIDPLSDIQFLKGPSIQDLGQIFTSEELNNNLFCLDGGGTSLKSFVWPAKTILLVGEEGAGLPQDLKKHTLSIPTQKLESLNANVALSIALYDYTLKNL